MQLPYETATGSTSSVAVASMRSDGDLGGRTGEDAFSYVVDLNRSLGAGTEFDEAELEVGDRAIRFTGEALHFGVLAAGGHLLTVIVPVGDASSDQVDALVSVMAGALG